MALQPLNFRTAIAQSYFTPGLLAGAITLFCGVTASFLSPSSRVSAALIGSATGATGMTILKKRQEQEVRHIVKTQIESHLVVINNDIAGLKKQFYQLQTETKAPAESTVIHPQNQPDSVVQPMLNLPSTAEVIEIDNTQSTNITDLIALLNARKIQVDLYHQPLPLDDLFDNLAVIMGEQYAILEPLHYQIIKSLQTGRKFSFNLANSSQKAISICTQFCQTLHGKSLLDSYYYDKKQKIIHAAPQIGNAEITQFLSGGWFERFVYKKVSEFLTSQGWQYQCLRNPQVVLKNGDKFELDLVFLVNNELIWIECKSGQQSSSALKNYCERKRALAIPKEKALLVSLKLSDAQTATWTKLWDMTVTNSNDFINSIGNALKK